MALSRSLLRVLGLALVLLAAGARGEERPDWTGAWQTYWRDGHALMTLEQAGAEVEGTFEPGKGVIAGSAEDGLLYGEWRQEGAAGTFVFALSDDGQSFTGRFESGEYWNGERLAEGETRGPRPADASTPRETLRTVVSAVNQTLAAGTSGALAWEPLLLFAGDPADERERRRRRRLLANIIDMSTFRVFNAPESVPPGEDATFAIGPDGSGEEYRLRFRLNDIGRWQLLVEREAELEATLERFLRSLGHGSYADYVADRSETPRSTMRRFIEGYAAGTSEGREQAIAMLDLGFLPQHLHPIEGPVLADYLYQIINRAGYVVWQELPNNPGSRAPYEHYRHPKGSVTIVPIEADEPPPERVWRFSADTLRTAPALFGAMQDLPPAEGIPEREPISDFFALREWMRQLSPALVRRQVMLETWQWGALLLSVLAALGAAAGLGRLAAAVLGRLLREVPGVEVGPAARSFVWPVRMVVFGLTIFLLFAEFGIGESGIAFVSRVNALIVALGLGWLAYVSVSVVGAWLFARAEKSSKHLDEIVTALATGLLKALIIVLTVIACADVVGLPYEGVITGLGIGGLALAFAARETVSNMLSAAILLVDRPFKRGDLIEAGGQWATLEAVGLRSTRLRTFDDSLLIIPNSQLSDQAIINWGKRRKRKVLLGIGLTFDTPRDRLDAFVDGLREVYEAQPRADRTTYYIGLKGFGPSSIDIELWGYFNVYGYDAQVHAQHALVADIVDLARRVGVSFAFPTRTIHVAPAAEAAAGIDAPALAPPPARSVGH